MIAKFELDAVKNIKAKYLSGGQKKSFYSYGLVIKSKNCFNGRTIPRTDLMSTNYLQETIVNLQTEDINRCCVISDHAVLEIY